MYLTADRLDSNLENCAGKNCSNKGTSQLTIVYLNRTGWFCDSCKQELLSDDLIIEHEKESG